ncbi:DUF4199 domain-containing protein [Mucilaginibacter sp. KACC 22063]|uniref:DUF4199 domain-containing protein n=1 Tax=Mucilaginibacter sp. KACC 22063 TaxID=3025666 RepID=UPI002365C743|nr:DUF4199 domain-containing protein [Mucilaginibacter sp. KACC 22063]WDF57093.1 DUF4199 domain-containing protein [Mucilaginibacter sp. KACC 22063]
MEMSVRDLQKKSATSGIILGIVLIVCSVLSFYFITTIATSIWMITLGPMFFSVIIPLIIAILFTSDLRKKIGGYWTFRQAVTGIFIMFFCAYVVSYIGYNLLFVRVIEPQAIQKTEEKVVGATTAVMEKQGVDQEKIDEQEKKMRDQFDIQNNMTPVKIISGVGISLIFMFVIAMIFAAIFKKDPPLSMSNTYTADDYVDPTV